MFVGRVFRCGTAVFVSFAFGAVVEQGIITSLWKALTGVVLLLVGIFAIATSGSLHPPVRQQQQQQQAVSANGDATAAAAEEGSLQEPLLVNDHSDASQVTKHEQSVCCVLSNKGFP